MIEAHYRDYNAHELPPRDSLTVHATLKERPRFSDLKFRVEELSAPAVTLLSKIMQDRTKFLALERIHIEQPGRTSAEWPYELSSKGTIPDRFSARRES